jgi:hypothetical protein
MDLISFILMRMHLLLPSYSMQGMLFESKRLVFSGGMGQMKSTNWPQMMTSGLWPNEHVHHQTQRHRFHLTGTLLAVVVNISMGLALRKVTLCQTWMGMKCGTSVRPTRHGPPSLLVISQLQNIWLKIELFEIISESSSFIDLPVLSFTVANKTV